MPNTGSVSSEVRCVVDASAHLGESPVWSVEEQALYWVDIGDWPGNSAPASVNRFDLASGATRHWTLPQAVGCMALHASGGAVVALASGVFRLDFATQALTPLAPATYDLSTLRLNDGKCDRAGRFWVGTCLSPDPRVKEGTGHLYCLQGNELKAKVDGISVANGLAWSPDSRVMYFTDSRQRTVWAFDYDIERGTVSNRRVFVQAPSGVVLDGATVDAEGGYWVALYNSGKIARYRPDGTLDREIHLPVTKPTMLAFGGRDLTTLYVTSASHRLTREELAAQPFAGRILALEPGVCGLPEPKFERTG